MSMAAQKLTKTNIKTRKEYIIKLQPSYIAVIISIYIATLKYADCPESFDFRSQFEPLNIFFLHFSRILFCRHIHFE